MWNDLMRRWMKLATWWLPNNEDTKPSSPASTAKPAQATPNQAKPAAAAPSPQPKPAPAKHAGSDLTGIKGIGPAMQKRLSAIGITTPADLAAADAKTLTTQLKADKAVVSEAQVSQWIEAARNA